MTLPRIGSLGMFINLIRPLLFVPPPVTGHLLAAAAVLLLDRVTTR